MKLDTQKTRVKEVGQSHQVTIVLKLKNKKDKTITHERGILTVYEEEPKLVYFDTIWKFSSDSISNSSTSKAISRVTPTS